MKTLNEHLKTNFSPTLNRLAMLLVLILLSVQYSAFAQKKELSELLEKPEYSTLKSLMSSAESELLENPEYSTLKSLTSTAETVSKKSTSAGFTFFAPTNDAFEALGEETLKYLFKNPEEFLKILSYHFVNTKVYASDLSDGQIVKMRDETDAFISLFDGKAYINQAQITKTDLDTYNGVIHIIDAVITQPQSIVDIVVNSPRHTTLEAAVIAADLAGALSGEGSFTLFAPTDDAFAALGEETISTLLQDPTGTLAEILKYHVVGATAFSGDLTDGDMFTTLEGSDINVMINEEGVFINDAQLVFADYAAPNGVVHVIDAVLTPPVPTNTVVDVIVNSEVHQTLEAAVIAAELAGALSSEGPFTVFAPSDEAFAALGEETINSLLEDPTGALAQILQYHVVAGSVMAGDLSDGQKVEMLEGTNAFVSLFDGKAYINQAMITVTDIQADNGVVHVIDAVITQPKSILDLIAINPRLTWLLDAIYAAGLDELLSGSGYFTIFAPSDDAWYNYLNRAFGGNYEKAALDYSNLLTYHTLEIETYANDLFDGDMLETLSGLNIKVTVNQDGVHLNESRIIYSDFTAPNGVLHIVDEVIAEEDANALGVEDMSMVIGNANIYPNPASSSTSVAFELEESSEIELTIQDLTGKTVSSEYFGFLPTGSQVINLQLDYLDAGLYIVNIKTGTASLSKKLKVE